MKQPKTPLQTRLCRLYLPFLCLFFVFPRLAQSQGTLIVDSSEEGFRTVIAGPEYKAGGIYRFFWGNHYRKEWTTPVRVPVVNLNTFAGGLTPIQEGGGRQSKTLRLQNAQGKQYVLRSIDKDYGKALPEIARGTFIDDLAKDAVSTGHPYASITIPEMIETAGVYHTIPQIVFVPFSPRLGQYNGNFANTLCLLEERPDENQEDAVNFGNSKDVKGTEKILENITERNDRLIDQPAFVRARLFDIFLGDWGRHDDQWRWAEFDSGRLRYYRPIPRDRDQAYAKFDGLLIRTILSTEPLEHLQNFDAHLRDVTTYNFPARFIDRRFTNAMTRDTWLNIARDLKTALTDPVIENGIHKIPKEIYGFSGPDLIRKLKTRRNELDTYADDYYHFLAKEVEIPGTEKDEYFLITRNGDDTRLRIYDITKEGDARELPYYDRTFHRNETREIRVFGLKGSDRYRIEGTASHPIKVRIIGGIDKDSVVNVSEGGKIQYYDNPGNSVTGSFRQHIDSDTAINNYNYRGFKYDHGGIVVMPNYTNTRGIFVELGYRFTRQQWRKEPFGWKQKLTGNYSISNKSFGGEYDGVFNELIGKWNLLVNARYDQKLKNYFLGSGNESPFVEDINFYKLYTREAAGTLGLTRNLGHHTIGFSGSYQDIKVLTSDEKAYTNTVITDPSFFNARQFAGAQASYAYLNINDPVVPTKGFGFSANASRTWNLTETDRQVNRYSALLGFYIPFSRTISLAVRSGAGTLTGNPVFYQQFWLGGGQNLRGYHRQRFYGNSVFFDNNEIRWIPNFKSYLFNGKIGLIAFLDNGRVWDDNEDSSKWHVGYGGGLMLAPFNKLAVTVYYGVSEEDQKVHIRLGRFF